MVLFLISVVLNFVFLNQGLGAKILPSLVFSFFLSLGIYAFKGFEPEYLSSFEELFVNDFLGNFFGGLVFLMFYPVFRGGINKYDLVYSVIFSSTVIPVLSTWIFRLSLRGYPPKEYIVIGKRGEFDDILDEIEKRTYGKIVFKEFINPSPATLKKKLDESNFDAILIADPELAREISDILRECKKPVEHLPSIVERYAKRIPVEVAEKFEDYYVVAFENIRGDSPAKRIVDVVVSLLALSIFSPVMLLISIAIVIEDGFPIIFRQKRIGKNGKVFTLYKFRSMKNDPSKKAKFVDEEVNRITKVGRFIRLYRLDELPQFVNVLKGEMSVVGPRPEQEEFGRIFEAAIPFYKYRYLVKPGLTGWAQINYHYSQTIEETKEKLSYDLWYVKNRNIFVDLRIILQTVETMIFKKGAK